MTEDQAHYEGHETAFVTKQQLIDQLRLLAETLRETADKSAGFSGPGRTESGRLMLQHSAEMRGAAAMVDSWIEGLSEQGEA